jgi:thioredoxin-like negative regulator of GroEL
VLLVVMIVGACGISPAEAQKPQEINWYRAIPQASERASKLGQHVLVVFHTSWCQWCRQLEDSTLMSPKVATLLSRVVFAKVNADLDTATAHHYNVRAFPTTILLTPEGNEVDRIVGFRPPNEFHKIVSKALDGKGTIWDLDRKLNRKPRDSKTAHAIAVKYTERGKFQESREYYQKVLDWDRNNADGWVDNALFGMARLHRENGDWYKAISGFRRIIDDHPDSELREDTQAYIAWLYAQAGDTAQAVREYEAFLDEFKDSEDRDWAEQQIGKLQTDDDTE